MNEIDFKNLQGVFSLAMQHVVMHEQELIKLLNFKKGLFDCLLKTFPIQQPTKLNKAVKSASQKTIQERKLKAVKKK